MPAPPYTCLAERHSSAGAAFCDPLQEHGYILEIYLNKDCWRYFETFAQHFYLTDI